MTDRVTVEGVPQLARNFAACADEMQLATAAGAEKPASSVRAETAADQPVLTGALAGSVKTRKLKRGYAIKMGGAKVPYAGWIEFGGSRGRPRIPQGRTLYPALESNAERAVDHLQQIAADIARRYSA